MMMMAVANVVEVLGGERLLGAPVRSPADLEARVRSGLPRHSLEVLAETLEPDPRRRKELIWSIVPRATWNRRKERLSTAESEVVERTGRLFAEAFAVWENADDARSFFYTPHALLGNRTPLEAARTELGGRQVERILLALQHGLPV